MGALELERDRSFQPTAPFHGLKKVPSNSISESVSDLADSNGVCRRLLAVGFTRFAPIREPHLEHKSLHGKGAPISEDSVLIQCLDCFDFDRTPLRSDALQILLFRTTFADESNQSVEDLAFANNW